MRNDQRDVVRFLLRHAMVGAVIACVAVALMVVSDFAQLRTLVVANDAGLLALAVMTVFFVITFASVQMGMALMFACAEPPSAGKGRRTKMAGEMVRHPASVPASPQNRGASL